MKQLITLELNNRLFELSLKQLKDNVVHKIINDAGAIHSEDVFLLDNLRMHCAALVICFVFFVTYQGGLS